MTFYVQTFGEAVKRLSVFFLSAPSNTPTSLSKWKTIKKYVDTVGMEELVYYRYRVESRNASYVTVYTEVSNIT